MPFRHPPKKVLTGKLWLYSVGGSIVAVLSVFLLLFLGRNQDPNSLLMFIIVAPPFAVPALGALWMIKTIIREEPRPWPLIALAGFIPFAFLWYYFERVRPVRLATED